MRRAISIASGVGVLLWLTCAALGCCAMCYRVDGKNIFPPYSKREASGKTGWTRSVFTVYLPKKTPACKPLVVYPQQPVAVAITPPAAANVKVSLRVSHNGSAPHGTFRVDTKDDLEDADLLVERGIYLALAQCLTNESVKAPEIPDLAPYYARYPHRTIGSKRSAIDLLPGMRVRLDRGSIANGQAVYGVGSVWFDVIADGARGVMISSATRIHNVSPPAASGIVIGSIPSDVNPTGTIASHKYLRLIIPNTITAPGVDLRGTVEATSNFVFVGSDDREVVDRFVRGEPKDRPFAGCASSRCVLFPGHTQAIVEIPVIVQGQETHVQLGTTLGDLVSGRLGGTHILRAELTELLYGRLSVMRPFGGQSLSLALSLDSDSWQDVPVAQGDDIEW